MLIATLKSLGKNPCAKCFVEKDKIHLLGTVRDQQVRSQRRIDDQNRRDKVTNARRWIFEAGYTVDSARVKEILGPGCLVPMHVSCSLYLLHILFLISRFLRMLIRHFLSSDSISMKCSCRISCTNSSSVFGEKPSSLTLFVFLMHKARTLYRLLTTGMF